MVFIPKFQLVTIGGWWFSVLFIATNIILGFVYPRLRSKVLVRKKGHTTLS